MQSIWWQIFDILGTAAFALSGAMVAISRRMDLFGVFVLAAATAVGGGITRDILLGNTPPAAFRTGLYGMIIIFSVLLAAVVIRYVKFSSHQRLAQYVSGLYFICDAIGLGAFTVTGTLLGYYLYPHYWIFNITLGVITAVGGGVIRDILAGHIPGVLKKDIYAAASLIGASMMLFLHMFDYLSIQAAAITGFVFTVLLRLIAVRLRWNLPRVRKMTKHSLF